MDFIDDIMDGKLIDNSFEKWLTGGGVLVAVFWYGVKGYLNKRERDSSKIIDLEQKLAVQNQKLSDLERQMGEVSKLLMKKINL